MEPRRIPLPYLAPALSADAQTEVLGRASSQFVSLQAVLTEKDKPQKLNRLALRWQQEDRLLGEFPPLDPML